MPVFKVWCERREKKKTIVTDSSDFDNFVTKGIHRYVTTPIHPLKRIKVTEYFVSVQAKFELWEMVRLVLEADGTEVEDAESLEAFKENVLMVLPHGAHWTDRHIAPPGDSFLSPPVNEAQPVNQAPLEAQTPLSNRNRQDTLLTPRSFDATPQRKRKIWSDNFQVPWNKLRTQLIKKLERSVTRETEPEMKLTKSEFNEVIRTVVAEVREFDTYPGRQALRKVAEAMTTKFKVLADLDEEGKRIGSGLGTLSMKLEEHNNYLNRPNNNSSLLALVSSPAGPDGRRKKRAGKRTAQCGTVEWQPEYPLDESKQSQSEKQKWLISESRKSTKDRDSETTNAYMEMTYPSQRLLLNKSDITVDDLKKEWPLLLEPNYIQRHCEKLVYNFKGNFNYWPEDKLKKIICLVEERVTVEKAKAILEKNEESRREKMALAEEGISLVNFAKKSPAVGAVNLLMHKFGERKKGSRFLFVGIEVKTLLIQLYVD